MRYDVAVIGAGIVGCAMARRFALNGARVLLLEKGMDILSGASKANSAILHTGFDAPTGSLELSCMQRGYDEYMAIHEQMNLSLFKTSAIVVAWSDEEVAKLAGIRSQSFDNGIDDVELLDRDDVLRLEPHLSGNLRAGLRVPREYIIDPWSPALAYVIQAKAHGAELVFGAAVTGGVFNGESWTIETSKGSFQTHTVINCAGNHGDRLDAALLGEANFAIKPRKGQFVVFDKAASALLTSIIRPGPTERTKGVVLTRTIFGNVIVGPTAEEQDDRERATVDQAALEGLVQKAVEIIPQLENMPVTAVYAGLRPASDRKEYRVSKHTDRNWITVGGIRSTGLTAALGIAQHVFGLYAEGGTTHAPVADPYLPDMPNLAEHRERDWQRAGYDEIVCHCEMVTKREITIALNGPVPPGDFGGLKRRTRCAMGRCQGFNCSGRLAELAKDCLQPSLTIDQGRVTQ